MEAPCLPSRDARSALNWSKRFHHSVPLAAAFSLLLGMSHHVSRRRLFRFELSSQGPGYPTARLGRRCALCTPQFSTARIATGARQPRWLVSGPFPPVPLSCPGRRGTSGRNHQRCRGKGSSLAGLVLADFCTVHPHRKDMELPCANPHLRALRSACLSLSHTIQLFAPGEQGLGFVIHFGGPVRSRISIRLLRTRGRPGWRKQVHTYRQLLQPINRSTDTGSLKHFLALNCTTSSGPVRLYTSYTDSALRSHHTNGSHCQLLGRFWFRLGRPST